MASLRHQEVLAVVQRRYGGENGLNAAEANAEAKSILESFPLQFWGPTKNDAPKTVEELERWLDEMERLAEE